MKVLDLFSGIGGFSLGLEKAGFETVAFCEIDKKARMVLSKHWPDVAIFDDVTTLTKEKLDEHGISVDVICGGFPCQDLSVAGKGAGLEGSRSGLWFEFHRLIKEIRPSWVIVENVSVLRSRGLDRVLRSLAEIGYDAEWHCIPASAVGAPHQRDRIWIVAHSKCGGLKSLSDWNAESNYVVSSSPLADPDSTKCETRFTKSSGNEKSRKRDRWITCNGSCLADTMRERLERQWEISGRTGKEQQDASDSRWWAVEPDVGRVAHGVPGRVDRLKQLGNAVVPQIPELIGRAIMDATNE